MTLALSNLRIVYFANAISKWSTIFKYYYFIVIFGLFSSCAEINIALLTITYASL